MQFLTRIARIVAVHAWEFQNDALWDTFYIPYSFYYRRCYFDFKKLPFEWFRWFIATSQGGSYLGPVIFSKYD